MVAKRAVKAPATGDETRFFGYRGIIVICAILALALIASVTGLGASGLCLIDPSRCPDPAPTATESAPPVGTLPAPSDELAVYTGAGLYAVPSVVGDPMGGSLRKVGHVWNPPPAPQASPPDSVATTELTKLACGTPETGPCDVWEGLEADSSSGVVNSASRLSLAGFDPLQALEGTETVVQLSIDARDLGFGGELEGVAGDSTDPVVLYRSARHERDGALRSTWTMTGKTEHGQPAVTLVQANHTRDGELVALTFSRIVVDSSEPAQVLWTFVELPATEVTRVGLNGWLGDFRASGLLLPAEIFEPTSPVTVDSGVLLRAVHNDAQVTSKSFTATEETPPLDTAALLEHLDLEGLALTLTETRALGAQAPNGYRSFVVQEPEA